MPTDPSRSSGRPASTAAKSLLHELPLAPEYRGEGAGPYPHSPTNSSPSGHFRQGLPCRRDRLRDVLLGVDGGKERRLKLAAR